MCDFMPTDIQFKDELRKDEIQIESMLEMIRNQEYEKLEKKLEKKIFNIMFRSNIGFVSSAGECDCICI